MKKTAKQKTFDAIAKNILQLETLEQRFSDRLDFYDLPVWAIQDALEAAFEAGRKQGLGTAKKG